MVVQGLELDKLLGELHSYFYPANICGPVLKTVVNIRASKCDGSSFLQELLMF